MNEQPDPFAFALVFCGLLAIVLVLAAIFAAAVDAEKKKCDKPKRVRAVRARRAGGMAADRRQHVMAEVQSPIANQVQVPVVVAPELNQPELPADIRQLMAKSSALVRDRPQTFLERWNNVDVIELQLAKKMESGRAALILIKQRGEILSSVGQMMLTATEQRRQILGSQLASIELEEQIAMRHELRDVRRDTQRALEEGKQRRLLEPARTRESAREQVIEDHRADVRARLKAGDQMLEDFLQEVHLICESRASIHERSLRLQNLLNVFELGEEALPADAVWILRTSEKLRDAS